MLRIYIFQYHDEWSIFFNGLNDIKVMLIVMTGYLQNCLCQGTAKDTFRSSSQAATCPAVYHTLWRLHTVHLIAEHQAGKVLILFFTVFDMT